MYHIPMALKCVYRFSDEVSKNGDGEDGSEISGRWRLPGFLFTGDLVLSGELEQDHETLLLPVLLYAVRQ